MKLSLGVENSVGQILSGFNGATTVNLGVVALLVKVGLVTQQVPALNYQRLGALQHHIGAGLAALNESYPFNLPPNVQLFD